MIYPVITIKPSYNSLVRGCPGLPDTLPRVECELRVRSSDGRPFIIEKIQTILRTVECLNVGLGSFTSKRNKIEHEVIHYKKNIRISEKKLIGIDVPLTIGLPDDIKETNYNAKVGHCYTILECNVVYNSATTGSSFSTETFSQLVNIERYVMIASSKLYPTISRKIPSNDKKFAVNLMIENPCVTSDDVLCVSVEVLPNLSTYSQTQKVFNRQVKLKHITFELKETMEFYDTNSDSKEHILETVTKTFNEPIPESGIKLKSQMRIATKNSLYQAYEASLNEPAVMYQLPPHPPNVERDDKPETVIIKGKHIMEPFQYHSSITTRGKLFSVIHALVIRFKISKGKDFEISYPIDISPWPKAYTRHIEQVISQEREIAKHARNFYQYYGGIKRSKKNGQLEYPPLPPVVYLADKNTLKQLGIEYSFKNQHPQRIFTIE